MQTWRRPSTCYMESVQTDINPMMRSILVDWLVEVAQEYRLTSDTLFLSVAYIDRFLSLVDVRRNKLQLVSFGWVTVVAGVAHRGSASDPAMAGACAPFLFWQSVVLERHDICGRWRTAVRLKNWPT